MEKILENIQVLDTIWKDLAWEGKLMWLREIIKQIVDEMKKCPRWEICLQKRQGGEDEKRERQA